MVETCKRCQHVCYKDRKLRGTYCSASIFFSFGGSILLKRRGVSSGHCSPSKASINFIVLCFARDVTMYQGYLQDFNVSVRPEYTTCLLTHSSCMQHAFVSQCVCASRTGQIHSMLLHVLVCHALAAHTCSMSLHVNNANTRTKCTACCLTIHRARHMLFH